MASAISIDGVSKRFRLYRERATSLKLPVVLLQASGGAKQEFLAVDR